MNCIRFYACFIYWIGPPNGDNVFTGPAHIPNIARVSSKSTLLTRIAERSVSGSLFHFGTNKSGRQNFAPPFARVPLSYLLGPFKYPEWFTRGGSHAHYQDHRHTQG